MLVNLLTAIDDAHAEQSPSEVTGAARTRRLELALALQTRRGEHVVLTVSLTPFVRLLLSPVGLSLLSSRSAL